MKKQKIYWCLQQLHNIGGTEMVTIQLINELCKHYEIHLISLSEKVSEPLYKVDKSVEIHYLNVKKEICQFDRYFLSAFKAHHYLKAIKQAWQCFAQFTIRRKKIAKKISEMTTNDDIIIFSSLELFFFKPKDRFIYEHFHYNSYLAKTATARMIRLLTRKPDFSIYLSESTFNILALDKSKATYINNPVRYEPTLNEDFHNNSLIFVGRFEKQKDPLLLLKAVHEAQKLNLKFNLKIFGIGSLRKDMDAYIKKYNLQNIEIIETCNDVKPYLLTSDLLLVTSFYEGFQLVTLEAHSLSCPALWIDCGDPTTDMITPGINGDIVYSRNPKDYALKLKELLDDKNKLIRYKKSTYESSKKYQIDLIANQWINLFDSHKERK